jgi:Holliday junction resolvase RusA-like endonuclease
VTPSLCRSVIFDVYGEPKPQGSMKAFAVGGQARVKPSGGEAFAAWRNAVAEVARREAEHLGAPLDGALRLAVTFKFAMPKSRGAHARNGGWVHKTTAPDLDKLVRCVGDAFTAANLVADDARIAVCFANKLEVHDDWTGAHIELTEIV